MIRQSGNSVLEFVETEAEIYAFSMFFMKEIQLILRFM